MRNAIKLLVLGAALTTAGLVQAQPWKAARTAGAVGEQTDGYLAVVAGGSQAMVDDINIQRKAAYTAQAQQQGVTVEAAGISAGCAQLRGLGAGMKYRAPGGAWRTVGQGELQLDPRCPR